MRPGVRFMLPPRPRSRTSPAGRANPYEVPWIRIKDAISLIMRHRDVGPETAQSNLRQACFSGRVSSRHLLALTDEHGEKRIGFPLLRRDAWNSGSAINVDKNSLHSLDLGTVEQVEIAEVELSFWLAKPRRGPVAGQTARYADADRALFGAIEHIMAKGSKSVAEAARDLAWQGKLNGRGTAESRVRRLANLYRKERLRRPG
jgi:hypothetical protein